MKPWLLLFLSLPLAAAELPVRGIHLAAPKPAELSQALRFIREALPKEGVNLLVLEINYNFKFSRHPEVADPDALSLDELRSIAAAARDAHVRLIPQINMLGHQSWAKTTFGLLRSHPEFDETPGKYPGNEGIYCRSYCPLHPAVHPIVFDLMDEVADACGADAFHVGMDEVFLLGEDDCPRCQGRLKSDLFAEEVRALRDHLAKSNRTLWIWGDRFLDGATTGIGKWEGSMNGTWPSIHLVPKDIVICDWHYDKAVPTAVHFATEGFRVVSSPWRKPEVALGQLELMRSVLTHANEAIAAHMLGMLQTTWCGMGPFVSAYYGEGTGSPEAKEAVACFRALFQELRK